MLMINPKDSTHLRTLIAEFLSICFSHIENTPGSREDKIFHIARLYAEFYYLPDSQDEIIIAIHNCDDWMPLDDIDAFLKRLDLLTWIDFNKIHSDEIEDFDYWRDWIELHHENTTIIGKEAPPRLNRIGDIIRKAWRGGPDERTEAIEKITRIIYG